MEAALEAFEDREIQASNTPIFIRDELRCEPIGKDTHLEKVLNWWRSDVWIPPEMRTRAGRHDHLYGSDR